MDNDYVWPTDPVGKADLDGTWQLPFDPNIPDGVSGVYVVRFSTGEYYVGQSVNMALRMKQHARSEYFRVLTVKSISYIAVPSTGNIASDRRGRETVEQRVLNHMSNNGGARSDLNLNRRNPIAQGRFLKGIAPSGPGWINAGRGTRLPRVEVGVG